MYLSKKENKILLFLYKNKEATAATMSINLSNKIMPLYLSLLKKMDLIFKRKGDNSLNTYFLTKEGYSYVNSKIKENILV